LKIYTSGSGDGIEISNNNPCPRGAGDKVCFCLKYLEDANLNCSNCLEEHEKYREYMRKEFNDMQTIYVNTKGEASYNLEDVEA